MSTGNFKLLLKESKGGEDPQHQTGGKVHQAPAQVSRGGGAHCHGSADMHPEEKDQGAASNGVSSEALL